MRGRSSVMHLFVKLAGIISNVHPEFGDMHPVLGVPALKSIIDFLLIPHG